jgi:hypothetical protein
MNIRTRLLLAAVLALGAGAALAADDAAAFPPGVVLEGSVETTTDAVIFPGDASGRLQVRSCEGCLHPLVAVDARTVYLLGGDSVSLKDMAQYALRTPGHALTIHYRLKDTVATRVTVLVR